MKRFAKIKRVLCKQWKDSILLICLNYGFTGINIIVASFLENSPDKAVFKMSIIFGIVMLCMAPISYFDPRKEMRGKSNVIMTCIMHFALSLFASLCCLSWVIIIFYAVEVAISVCILLLKA